MIQLILMLSIAHMAGDFVLQPTSWVEDKKKNLAKSKYLYFHIIVHLIVLVFALNFQVGKFWFAIALISISHYFIDLIKLIISKKLERRWHFWTDQIAHISVIAFVVYYYYPYEVNLKFIYSENILLVANMIVFVTFGASVLMKVLIGQLVPKEKSEQSIEKAGKYIGMLERVLVFCFVVLSQWQPIGFLIAAKSIFRFGDLSKAEDRKKTEYILIGTLLSFLIAIATGLAYNFLSKNGFN